MNAVRLRKGAIATLSLALALSLSACGSGNQAATRMVTQVTDGVDGSITTMGNKIHARSFLIVAQPDGSGVVVGTIVNDAPSEDALIAMAANQGVATLSSKNLPLLQGHPIIFSGATSNASAVIPSLNALPGTRVKLQMFFAIAGEMSLDVIVRERSGEYAGVGA
ncbi:MAG: hypothetical protein NTX12_03875 [Actinobacteria bacterium]|nr:hypothetical protein [Actinomycetota bacterium]